MPAEDPRVRQLIAMIEADLEVTARWVPFISMREGYAESSELYGDFSEAYGAFMDEFKEGLLALQDTSCGQEDLATETCMDLEESAATASEHGQMAEAIVPTLEGKKLRYGCRMPSLEHIKMFNCLLVVLQLRIHALGLDVGQEFFGLVEGRFSRFYGFVREAFLRELLDSAPDGKIIFSPGFQGG